MPELPQDFARIWIEFDDPTDAENIYRCDLTWLTSSWHCIYGAGCQGIVEGKPEMGCCTLGAHFSDKDDEKRVAKFVKQLTPETWENYKAGQKSWTEEDEDGSLQTRVHRGGCIFQNSPSFEGGGGCALHQLAVRTNQPISKTKPDVCWQLPIRRDYEWRELPDGERRFVISIEEYTRAGWGSGGSDLHWYCTSNPVAHTSATPVYISEKTTLIELMGDEAYEILARHCDARLTALTAAARAVARRASAKEVRSIILAMGGHPADPIPSD